MIKPISFDPVTAREMTGDERARSIEAKARADADRGVFEPPPVEGETYADRLFENMARVVYREQHAKRKARNERKATA